MICKIIVEKLDGQWIARFLDEPQAACEGDWPVDALLNLFQKYRDRKLDTAQFVDVTDDAHQYLQEFLIPCLDLNGKTPIPNPVLNEVSVVIGQPIENVT